jgi:hypothetical protein
MAGIGRTKMEVSYEEHLEYQDLVRKIETVLGSWDKICEILQISPGILRDRLNKVRPVYFEQLAAMRWLYRAALQMEMMKNRSTKK